jgi:hypothetical protein
LLPGEFADEEIYQTRTLPSSITLSRSNLKGLVYVLNQQELKNLDNKNKRNRYIIEPYETVKAKMRVIFCQSRQGYNLTGVLNYSRLVTRGFFCRKGAILSQEVCDDINCYGSAAGGCRKSTFTVDSAHGRIGTKPHVGLALNTAIAMKLLVFYRFLLSYY